MRAARVVPAGAVRVQIDEPVLIDQAGPEVKEWGPYTSLLALDEDSFLPAYSEFPLPNAKGEPCKSILARRVSVEPAMRDPISLRYSRRKELT